jgi:glutamate racemase
MVKISTLSILLKQLHHQQKPGLPAIQLINRSQNPGELTCYVSDRPQRFNELAERFLGRKPENVFVESLRD